MGRIVFTPDPSEDIRSIDASSSSSEMNNLGYLRVEDHDDDEPSASLRCAPDCASTSKCLVDLDELEQEELADRLCDIPQSFHRRHRRVAPGQDTLAPMAVPLARLSTRRIVRQYRQQMRTHMLGAALPVVCSYPPITGVEALYGAEGQRTSYAERHIETNALLHPTHHEKSQGEDSEDSKEEEDEEEDEGPRGVKKYAKLILPHVALVLLTCAYTVLGASIFYSVERPHELETKAAQLRQIYTRQTDFVDRLVYLASTNNTGRAVWEMAAKEHLDDMSDQLFLAFEKYFLTSVEVKRNTTTEIWSFPTSIFFAVTVVTTIGYGNPVPVTNVGRIVCIMFSLFGIPLTLVTIADLGKFLSEHLIWMYGNYLRLKTAICNVGKGRDRREHVCEHCQSRGIGHNMHIIEEQRIPAILVLAILVAYTALGGVLMSKLEPWSFFTSFYWSFITMTTVGFGDLMPRRDEYMYLILLYIVLGLAITTMCIDLVGVQYIRKIHYFGRKIQDARSALAVVGGKVVLVSELYANLMQKRARNLSREAFIIENLYISKHIIPFIPKNILEFRYIDQMDGGSPSTSLTSLDLHSCRFCHSRFSISHHNLQEH